MTNSVIKHQLPSTNNMLVDNSNDDYEYDIPSNNKPLSAKLKGVNPSYSDDSVSSNMSNNADKNDVQHFKYISMTTELASTTLCMNVRKSSSPTIDSGNIYFATSSS